MRVTLLDKIETSHTIIPQIESDVIVAHDGLQIRSETPVVVAGMAGTCFVVLIAKGSQLNLPERLANRLLDVGHAKESAS